MKEKPKRKKRRYFTANEIRDAIDLYKVKAQKFSESADAYDLKADELFRTNDPKLAEDAGFAREIAKKRRRSANRIKDKKLPYLAQKLAEWSTDLLPGMGSDRSVEA